MNRSKHAKKRVRDSKGRFISKPKNNEEEKNPTKEESNPKMNDEVTIKEEKIKKDTNSLFNNSVKTVVLIMKSTNQS